MPSLRGLRTSLIPWNSWKVSELVLIVDAEPKLQHDTRHGKKGGALVCLASLGRVYCSSLGQPNVVPVRGVHRNVLHTFPPSGCAIAVIPPYQGNTSSLPAKSAPLTHAISRHADSINAVVLYEVRCWRGFCVGCGGCCRFAA